MGVGPQRPAALRHLNDRRRHLPRVHHLPAHGRRALLERRRAQLGLPGSWIALRPGWGRAGGSGEASAAPALDSTTMPASYPTRRRRTAIIPAVLAAIALLAGLALLNSEGFIVIRFAVSILALVVAVFAWQAKQWWWLIGLVPIAVLWNPAFPIDLGNDDALAGAAVRGRDRVPDLWVLHPGGRLHAALTGSTDRLATGSGPLEGAIPLPQRGGLRRKETQLGSIATGRPAPARRQPAPSFAPRGRRRRDPDPGPRGPRGRGSGPEGSAQAGQPRALPGRGAIAARGACSGQGRSVPERCRAPERAEAPRRARRHPGQDRGARHHPHRTARRRRRRDPCGASTPP